MASPNTVDTGVLGPLGPDTGDNRPDTGEVSDCVEVTAPDFPPGWPYARTKQGYEANFFNVLKGPSAADIGCGGGACHSNNAQPPYIPTRAELDDDALLQKAIDQLWAVTSRPGLKSATVLRSAHLEGGEAEGKSAKFYTIMEEAQLYLYEGKTIDCRWVDVYRARPDGGGCSDAGPGMTADGGVAGQCECPLPERDLTHCESP